MSRYLKNTAICGALAVCVVLAAGAAAALAPPTQSVIFEGPGGRTPLTRWTLRSDPANRGLALGWRNGHFGGTTVSLPNVVHPAPYSGRAGARNYEGSVAWYQTSFQAPRPGTYALSFQSANFRATVWVDGHEVGSHRGSYLPFEARAALAAGRHTAVVRVDWRDPAEQSREGFHRTWFNWGGLDGEVDVRPIGESELSHPTISTTLSPDTPGSPQATVTVSVEVHNNASQRTIVPEGSLVHGGQTVPLSFPPQNLAKDQTATARTTVTIPQPALWSPRAPNLYALSLAVGSESSFSAQVGLRQLTWSQGRAYLNGQRLLLHGASIQEDARGHGDALTPGDQNTLVSELRAIGANAVRSQHPLDPALLERLDAAGILVWQGVGPVEGAGNWYSSTSRLDAEAEQQARTAVLAAELHPSIVVWNLVDEVAGTGVTAPRCNTCSRSPTGCMRATRAAWSAVDIWGDHPPVHAGSLYSGVDAIAETDYTGWYDSPRDSLAQQSIADARAAGGDAADVRRQGAGDQRVRRGIQHAQPPRQPGQLQLPVTRYSQTT